MTEMPSISCDRIGAGARFAGRKKKRLGRSFLLAALLFATTTNVLSAESPVADAAESTDAARVQTSINRGDDVDAPQVDGMTALHWACYHDELKLARMLIKAGANATATNRYGVTPLSLACQNGNGEMVELLLEAGADPNTSLRGGETALMTAARTGEPGAVKALVSHGANANAKERRGQTALMWAAAEGHTEVVKCLIEAGADFRSTLDSGFNPFFFAVREGRTPVVELLLKAGAEVNEPMRIRKHSGRGPRGGTSALLLAVENGHFELASRLLAAGADPNDQRSGFTPLHVITWVRKPDRGDDESGQPPPQGSGTLTSLEFVRQLVAHGADVNARLEKGSSGRGKLSTDGATAFLMASKTADIALMKLLVELGADPFLPNQDGATPLMAAAGLGCLAPTEEAGTEPECLEAVKYLLSLGADVNTVDDNGETAMHGAAYKSLPRMVQLLADNGAKIEVWNRKDKWGWTPLRIAEGYRPGNFKPSADTIVALQRVMLAAGVEPPVRVAPAIETVPNYPASEPKKRLSAQ